MSPKKFRDENNSSVSAAKTKARRDDSDFSDPVFKKLSRLNGEINKMTKNELKSKLTNLRLDSRGVKDILKRRLKNYYKKQNLMKAHIKAPGGTKYDYLIVIDYEATCMENNANYKHEIIEFPAVLIDVQEIKVVDEFHCYCRPRLNHRLTEFCISLTGITQEKVDAAPEFVKVLSMFEEWLSSHHLYDCYKTVIVTDGPWDMSRFLFTQCQLLSVPYPHWATKWINIRKLYGNYYQCRRCGIEMMLSQLGMTFEGTLHCGLDDTRNIARIALRMLKDGCVFKVNEYINILHEGRKQHARIEGVTEHNSSDDDTAAVNSSVSSDMIDGTVSTSRSSSSADTDVTHPPLTSSSDLSDVRPSASSSEDTDITHSVSSSSQNSELSSSRSVPVLSSHNSQLSEPEDCIDDLIHYYTLQAL